MISSNIPFAICFALVQAQPDQTHSVIMFNQFNHHHHAHIFHTSNLGFKFGLQVLIYSENKSLTAGLELRSGMSTGSVSASNLDL